MAIANWIQDCKIQDLQKKKQYGQRLSWYIPPCLHFATSAENKEHQQPISIPFTYQTSTPPLIIIYTISSPCPFLCLFKVCWATAFGEIRIKWMPKGQEVSFQRAWVIASFKQWFVTQLVLQFCPSCHVYSYVLLLSSAEIVIFMLLTCSRNYWIL